MKPDEDQEEMLVTYTLMQKKRPLTKFEEDLGVSSEYDRRIYDSPSARREYVFMYCTPKRTKRHYSLSFLKHLVSQHPISTSSPMLNPNSAFVPH